MNLGVSTAFANKNTCTYPAKVKPLDHHGYMSPVRNGIALSEDTHTLDESLREKWGRYCIETLLPLSIRHRRSHSV